jgi:hypothetical protein
MRFAWVVTLGLLAAGSAVAQTPQDALKQVPEEALGCVLINRIEATSGKFDAAAKRMKIEVPMTMIEALEMVAKGSKGWNLKGSALVVIQPGGPLGATPIVLVPIAKYGDFTAGLGAKREGDFDAAVLAVGEVLVAPRGKFAAVVKAADVEALKKFLATKGDGPVSKSLQAQSWADECELAAVALKPAIDMGSKQALAAIKQLEQQKFPDPTMEELMDVYRKIGVDVVEAMSKDVPFAALVARIDVAGNIDVSVRAPFTKGSATAKAILGGPAASDQILAGLPDISYAIAAGGALPAGATEALAALSAKFSTALAKDMPPEKRKQLLEASRESSKGIRSFSFVMGNGKPDEPLFHGVFAAYRVDDSTKTLDQMTKSSELSKEFLKNIKLPGIATGMEIQSLKVAGKPAISIVTDMSGLPDDPNNPAIQQLKDLYYGPGGKMTMTMTAVDKETIFVRYTSPAEAEDYVKNHLRPGTKSLDKNADVMRTTALFPKGTQFTMLVDTMGMVRMINRVMFAMLPPGQPPVVMPAAPVAPPTGLAGKITPEGAQIHLILPAPTQDSIGVFVGRVKAMFQQGVPGAAM